jgi:hypothetical protein
MKAEEYLDVETFAITFTFGFHIHFFTLAVHWLHCPATISPAIYDFDGDHNDYWDLSHTCRDIPRFNHYRHNPWSPNRALRAQLNCYK